MANTNAPFGFSFLAGPAGAAPSAQQGPQALAVYNAAAMFRGDPIKIGADGYVVPWTAATSVAQLWGIFTGCSYLSVSQGRIVFSPYWPGSDVASGNFVQVQCVPIIRAPNSLFIVQATLTPFTQADIGNNCDVDMGTGNTLTGQSGATLNRATIANTATLPFTIVGLAGQNGYGASTGVPGSDPTASYNQVIVSSNAAAVAGI